MPLFLLLEKRIKLRLVEELAVAGNDYRKSGRPVHLELAPADPEVSGRCDCCERSRWQRQGLHGRNVEQKTTEDLSGFVKLCTFSQRMSLGVLNE